MRYFTKNIMLVLMILLVPIYLISCSGNSTTSLPSDNNSAVSKAEAPGRPTVLTATGGDSHVDLRWTPPQGATSYNLYWSKTRGVTKASDKILNVSMPFAHLELLNGTTYYYRVSALNIFGESALSDGEVQATPALPFMKILTKLTDPDAEDYDEFGWSVAIDGDYAVVGARRSGVLDQNNIILEEAGAAYVFQRTNGIWNPAGARLTAPDAQAYDYFGSAVSISGDYIIVGALQEDGGPGDPTESEGAVYIFNRIGANTWDAGTKVSGQSAAPFARFGSAVSISGDYAVIGEPGQSRAYVFKRTGKNAWDDGGTLLWVPDTEPGDLFGRAVAISGDYIIIGARGEDGGAGNPMVDLGAAYVFHRTADNSWNLASKVMPHDGKAGDMFGHSVAISGDYAAVGAYANDMRKGAVYVFHRLDENFWDEGPKITASDSQVNDRFGISVSVSEHFLLIGADLEDCGWDNNDGEGAAYLFKRIGANTWDGGTKITIPQGDVGDKFGFSVAISGESAIIGAVGDDRNEMNEVLDVGAVYLY